MVIAHGNTHIAEVASTRRRDLTINVQKAVASVPRDDRSSTYRITSGAASSAHENGAKNSIQRTTISDDMDMISTNEATVSAAELTISDDMDMISTTELTISDDMDMISTDELTVSAAELTVSDDMDMISPHEATISSTQGSTSLDEHAQRAVSLSDVVLNDTDRSFRDFPAVVRPNAFAPVPVARRFGGQEVEERILKAGVARRDFPKHLFRE